MFLQLSGQKFINVDQIIGIEFGLVDHTKDKDEVSEKTTDFLGLKGPLHYNCAYVYFAGRAAENDNGAPGTGSKFNWTFFWGEDALILGAFFDQHRTR